MAGGLQEGDGRMSVTDKNELRQLEGKGLHISAPPDAKPDPAVNLQLSDEVYTGQEYRKTSSGKKEKKESVGKDITILVMITLVSGLLLGAAYGVTKDPIARAQAEARAQAQRTVMSSAEHFETLYSSGQEEGEEIPDSVVKAVGESGGGTVRVTQIDAALDRDQALVGYVVTAVSPEGYGGDVELMCGIAPQEDGAMTIRGISFLSLSETAGMGMRAKDEAFLNQFSGKRIEAGQQLDYVKNGASEENEIDAISGCTITTSAVTDDVNAALTAAIQVEVSGQETERGAKKPEQEESE